MADGKSNQEFVTISSGDLTARIALFGAELWSLADRAGREYMTSADPAYWTGHAPILFPIVGGLAGNRYRLDGRTYEMPRHGFARHSMFELVEAEERSVRLRLVDGTSTRKVYPFAFVLDLVFRIEGMTLAIAAEVSNPGDGPLPFGFGYHPAFAWPLPGGAAKGDHVIAFEHAEPGPIRRLAPSTGLVLSDPVASPVEGHLLRLDPALFADDALVWDRLASRALTFGAPGAAQLSIAYPEMPMLGIWQKPGANFLCIEPWQGHADEMDFRGDFQDKPGIIELEPGQTRSLGMDVTVLAPD